jgi:hypothetical protein
MSDSVGNERRDRSYPPAALLQVEMIDRPSDRLGTNVLMAETVTET